jgi:hypothetical protein
MKNHSLHSVSIFTILIPALLIVILLGIIFLPSSDASGQSVDEGWSPPVNLSQSGGAGSPVMVVDETGMAHVFWLDEYAGYFYRSGDGETWGSRTRVDPPFDPYSPSLALGSNNRVHAFWIDEDNDLYWSRASVDELSSSSAWESPLLMASFVVDFSVEVDALNGIHVSFIYNEDDEGLAAGVGYLSSSNNGSSWSEPESLFQSPYIRGLASANANIDMASTELGEGVWVYAGWDNPVRKQISLARSLNGGSTWEDPIMIDGPDVGDVNTIPYNLRVKASEERSLVVWLRRGVGGNCSLHYRWSEDAGNNWSERQQMMAEYQGCPVDVHFIPGGDNLFLLQVGYMDRIYLLVWDGIQWSIPQQQSIIAGFEDPETLNLVNLECPINRYVVTTQELFFVGCDSGEGKDIWFTRRELGDTSAWYPGLTLWDKPIILYSSLDEINNTISIASPGNLLNVFWSQGEGGTVPSASRIYNLLWNGERWFLPSSVLSSEEGNAWDPAAVIDPEGRVFVVWSGGDSGEIHFSWAAAEQTYRSSDWTNPMQIPSPVAAGSSPDIYIHGMDRLSVAYAVPLNETRGVYLVSSENAGGTWSDPQQVYNAVENGWDMVDEPKLTVSMDGTFHILFTRFSLPGGRGPLSLHYTRSLDGGITWSEPETVAEQQISWSQISTGESDLMHRMWKGIDSASNRPVVYHQYSLDNGANWSSMQVVSPLQLLGPVDLVVDSAGRLHLIMSVTHANGEIGLEYWIWSGDRWTADQGVMLEERGNIAVDSLTASITSSGRLGVLYSGTIMENVMDTLETADRYPIGTQILAYTSRDLDLLAAILPPIPELPPLPTQTAESVLLESTELTPTIDLPVPAEEESLTPLDGSADNTWTGLVLGAGLAVILVSVAFGINAKKMGRR